MATFTCEKTEYRIHDGAVQKRAIGERRWQPVTLGALAKEYSASEGPWLWLRERGVSRPSPSGYTPEAEAKRDPNQVQVKLRLDKSIARELDALAREDGATKSETITDLVVKERNRRDRRAK